MASQPSALFATLLLSAAQPAPLLLFATAAASVLTNSAPVKAQSAEDVGRVARAITVRIEGAGSPGSGVLVKREGNRYTVLTAWHVVSVQGPGEELAIITPDGESHSLGAGSIKRLGQVDMAVLNFFSPKTYDVARIGDVKSVSSGDQVFVAGFPTASHKSLIFESGVLVANATIGIDQGYQLQYSIGTVSGMSGGVVLTAQGTLIGIHGRGEIHAENSLVSGQIIKTGVNQGVPITYYLMFNAGGPIVAPTINANTADDYLVQARALVGKKDKETDVIGLTSKILAMSVSLPALYFRAIARSDLGDKQGAIADLTQLLAVDPQSSRAYYTRGNAKSALGDKLGAIADYNEAIAISPKYYEAYANRGVIKSSLGDMKGAIADYDKSLAILPQSSYVLNNRGAAKYTLGDKQGAIADYSQAIVIYPQYAYAYRGRGIAKYHLGDMQGALADYNQAIAIDPKYAAAYASRGTLREFTGDLPQACSDWRTAASLGSGDAADRLRNKCQ